jgi:hypothetical protein
MSQCGSCSHSVAVLTMYTYFFAFSPNSTMRESVSQEPNTSSRNSGGSLVSLRRRWTRSSGDAAGSIIPSIVLAASSAARRCAAGLAGRTGRPRGFEPQLDQAARWWGRTPAFL